MLRQTGRQVGLACLVLIGLAVVGVPGVPPVATILVAGGFLVFVLPGWYRLCRRRTRSRRVLVVGDEPRLLESVLRSVPTTPVGFLSPVLSDHSGDTPLSAQSEPPSPADDESVVATDGGRSAFGRQAPDRRIERLGGLAQLERVLRTRDVDTVALAFSTADRETCFSALRTCRDHGVEVLAHESLSTRVRGDERVGDSLIRVDLEPWPWYSRAIKRAFDVVFAAVGLVVLAPLLLGIAVAIKLDSPGPVLYRQTRTSVFGEPFTLVKFRSMVTDAEADGIQLSREDAGEVDPRVTDIGHWLRKTHLDEIPQLLSILSGAMSVVGPRPERPAIDRELTADGLEWPKRWFVKPGLTGLAQINDVTGFEPETKLAYDLEYVRRRSLWFDIKLVCRQLWLVVADVTPLALQRRGTDEDSEHR
ncbi:sugar transferase [Natronococcus occultus]|uniref:sugar transferase n=1 Tax=Natronococcus occultus TaxID=29288 RepID=UPI000A905FC0|nr:sugar transferase [Natronococcus occultus]